MAGMKVTTAPAASFLPAPAAIADTLPVAAQRDVPMSSLAEMDVFDRHILRLLQADAAITTREMSKQVGLSQAPCWRRIKRLQALGIIKTRTALLDRRRVGLNVMMFAHVTLEAHRTEALTKFEEEVQRFPEVLECYCISGNTDYLLKIVVSEIEAYDRFLRDFLLRLPLVQMVNSTLVLSEVKSLTALPIAP